MRLTRGERQALVAAAHDRDLTGSGCSCDAVVEAVETILAERLAAVNRALGYISSPTMGLPSGRDAAEFAMETDERMARLALQNCIMTARHARLAAIQAKLPAPPMQEPESEPEESA